MKIILLILLSLPSLALSSCPDVKFPEKLTLSEHFFSIGSDFSLSSEGKSLGAVVEKVISIGTTFEFKDASGVVIAKGKKAVFTLGTKMEVWDCAGVKIGSIEAEFMENFFTFYSRYSIKDATGKEVARSQKVKLLATTFDLSSPEGEVAKIYKPWLTLTDKWTIELKSKAVDPRIIILMAAFKTSSDKAKAAASSSSSSK